MTKDKKYSYDRFGSKGVRVGQAVHDLISQEQPEMTAEEMLELMGKGVMEYIQDAAEQGYKKFDSNFYIIHIFRKTLANLEVSNAMQQKAVCFIDGPKDPRFYMQELPHATKTLYEVDRKNGVIKLCWTVPGWEDCKSIKKNPGVYDPDLVKWVKDATHGLDSKLSA